MNIILFIVALVIAFIVVRIGAIAFQLTGLEWSLAKFQALSCFTGTGFTTKEAELITGNPRRRRIASFLIILGHAGLVALIATFANSLRPGILIPKFTIPFLHSAIPSGYLPLLNLIIIIIAIYVIYRIFTSKRFSEKITNALRARIVKQEFIKPVSFEELLIATGGYGVAQIEVSKQSPVLNKKLLDADLRKLDILVLAVVRDETTVPNPPADTEIVLGDRLICFGKLENIRTELCVTPG